MGDGGRRLYGIHLGKLYGGIWEHSSPSVLPTPCPSVALSVWRLDTGAQVPSLPRPGTHEL